MHFDYVIVGGGSAGCVLANRLSADPSLRVLLIEAGRDTPPGQIPPEIQDSYPMGLFYGDRYIWPTLQARITRRPPGVPENRVYEQGRVMGGGSSINVQAANRGLPRDYDEWARLGAQGWGWSDVLPFFRKLERDLDFSGELHGNAGPLPIRRIMPKSFPPFGKAVASALAGSGLSMRLDQNADFEDGLFPPAFSNENDRRVSAALAYLDTSVRKRANLEIWAESHVVGLRLDGPQVREVHVRRSDGIHAVKAVRVVLAAGALQSPALLLRAGIGPAKHLDSLGIAVRCDLAGVGQNLRDHPALTLAQYLPRRLRLPMSYRRASFVAMRYSSGLEEAEASDMYVTASARAGWHGLGHRLGLYFLWCNRPFSSGSVTLRGRDADLPPVVNLNLLSDPRDTQRLMDGVRRLAKLVTVPELNANPADLFPAAFSPRIKRLSRVSGTNRILNALLGCVLDAPAGIRGWLLRHAMLAGAGLAETLDDASALEAFVRSNVFGVWHASGTCRMGSEQDEMAVVGVDGKVHGMVNLYVADASVMPRLPTANTNIPVLMVAEKISHALLRSGQ